MNKTMATVFVPIAIGVAAALFNLMAVTTATKTVDLLVVKEDVKVGTELKDSLVQKLTVRADKDVFRSAVRYEDRGAVIGRKVKRPLAAKEVVLIADVRLSGHFDVSGNLKPGEKSLTLSVKSTRIVPGLRVDDMVEVVLAGGSGDGDDPPDRPVRASRTVGPYRVVGVGDRDESISSSSLRGDERQVVLAYGGAGGAKDFAALEKAYRGDANERVVGIEYAYTKPR